MPRIDPRIDPELLEEEFDDVDVAAHRRRRGSKPSVKAQERIDDAAVARVVAVARGLLEVFHDERRHPARFAGSMRGTKVVVGDRVGIRPARHDSDVVRVVSLLDRTSTLTRTPDDADDTERLVVANADVVAAVVSADHLEPVLGFVDRVMVAASAGGLAPMVVVNKVDLADPDEVEALVGSYRDLGVAVHLTSALAGTGLDALAADLAGRWTAFTGHSGVGKSSLFNLLVPAAEQAVADVGRRGGRHTTVAAVAQHIPATDAWLVDTPGVRSFGLGTVTVASLARHFPELAHLPCALDDCQHAGEPGCAIGTADISPRRWESYERLRSALTTGSE
jgi:ribosome biogenesis GTPase